ncbi:VCBS domain-containing protein, partial [Bradyrhizobium sp. LHD-71]|uniref:VCBS domain-containing protein n=1 Tax=Bradyrhizobium sp. LHD-71 TaxID=3072141 RepID=UPI00280D2F48
APTFSVQVSDGFDTSNTFDATIAFNAVNDPPVAVADTNWVQEDLYTRAEGNVILGASHLLDPALGHLPGDTFADVADTDAEASPLTLNSVNGSSANVSTPIAGNHGTAWLNPSGSYFYILNNATAQWLDAGETVTDQFTYTVTDGTATSNTSTLTITIFGSSDADNFQFAADVGTAADELASAQGTVDLSMLMTAGNVEEGIAQVAASVPDGLTSLDDDQLFAPQNVLTASLAATDFIVNPTGGFR